MARTGSLVTFKITTKPDVVRLTARVGAVT
jgi:hypothetical protein